MSTLAMGTLITADSRLHVQQAQSRVSGQWAHSVNKDLEFPPDMDRKDWGERAQGHKASFTERGSQPYLPHPAGCRLKALVVEFHSPSPA